MDYLKRKLREVEPSLWELIAKDAGVAKTLPRKIVYDAKRENPKVGTIQPLYDYFKAVEAGTRKLPDVTAEKAGAQ